jgi:hypothetical protein
MPPRQRVKDQLDVILQQDAFLVGDAVAQDVLGLLREPVPVVTRPLQAGWVLDPLDDPSGASRFVSL